MTSEISPTSYWLQFFQSAGIPTKISLQYAKLFVEHRIQKWQLSELNSSLLKEIGITAVGDVLAIVRFAKLEAERRTLERLGFVDNEKRRTNLSPSLKRTSEGILAHELMAEQSDPKKSANKRTIDIEMPVKKQKTAAESHAFNRTVRVSGSKKPGILNRLGGVTVTLQKSGRVTFSPETKEEEVTSTTSGYTALESDKILSNNARESMSSRLGAKRGYSPMESRLGPKITRESSLTNDPEVFQRLGRRVF